MSKIATVVALLGMFVVTACGSTGSPDTAQATTTTEATTAEATTASQSSTPAPSTWKTDDVSTPFGGAVPPVPRLTAIRVGSHPDEGHDRVTMEFDALPGFEAGYRPAVARDGSGKPVRLPGKAFLQITFDPATAHDDKGNSAVADHPVTASYPALKAYLLSGDFEGLATVVLATSAKVGFRIGSDRTANGHYVVYVDLAHP
jgi:hypothetical protein